MAKARSPKLRTLITLHALFKYTDENHRLNSTKLNDFLRPYGLECNKKIIMDTAAKLNEAGIEVNLAGGGPYKGICLTNRPLPDHELRRLIYAIDTNPNISREQAQTLLDSLRPAVTVFQEPMLHTTVHSVLIGPLHPSLTQKYNLIHTIMTQNHRVCFSRVRLGVDKKKKTLTEKLIRAETLLPRYLIQRGNNTFVVGYNHTRQRIEAVNLKDMTNLQHAQYNNLPEVPGIIRELDKIDPYNYLPMASSSIYEGPAVFYCAAKCLQALYDRFGTPCGPVERDERYRLTYPVSHVTIAPETLQWMGDIPGNGIRFIGPAGALEAVRANYQKTCNNLLGIESETPPSSERKRNDG